MRLEHPSQSEHYRYDDRGLRIARTVIIPAMQDKASAIVATTGYEHDEQGQLTATSLPDGSQLVYERNGQGQVVALKRSQLNTPWLQRKRPANPILKVADGACRLEVFQGTKPWQARHSMTSRYAPS